MLSRRSFARRLPVGLAVFAGCQGTFGFAASIARARVQSDYTYSWTQVWQTAVRLVRVDLRSSITDRDEDVGYVMFDYADAGRTHPASVELVRAAGSDGVERVRVVVQVPSLPSWVERWMVDRLSRKLREDFGEPPRAARPARPAPVERESPDTDRPENEGQDGQRARDAPSGGRPPEDAQGVD